jgi:hypothetical protein
MKPFRTLQYLLLGAALFSGALTMAAQTRACYEWRNAPAEMRTGVELGMSGPAILKVRATVPETDGLLIISDIDPALFPYALFPRKIWQVRTAPETDQVYMDLPPSPYPQRPLESFPVNWLLNIRGDTVATGGELTRIQPYGSMK